MKSIYIGVLTWSLADRIHVEPKVKCKRDILSNRLSYSCIAENLFTGFETSNLDRIEKIHNTHILHVYTCNICKNHVH